MTYSSFEDLDIWKKACKLAVRVYQVLHDCKDYGLKHQMTRAGVSIASNIAEGRKEALRRTLLDFYILPKAPQQN